MIHVIVFCIVTFFKKKEIVNYDTEKNLKKKKKISCGCTSGCTNSGGCRKTGIKCDPMRNICQGQTCTNCPFDLECDKEYNTIDEIDKWQLIFH